MRENGAQYTHAAVWTIIGFAMSGEVEKAWELLSLINPVNHALKKADTKVYSVEPYVVAADIYTNPQHLGRGGWTWYTGSAGWLYRLVVETLLGITLQVDHLSFKPLLPASWKQVKVHYRYHQTFYHIEVTGQLGSHKLRSVAVDGVEQPDHRIPLVNDHREHKVVIQLGGP